MILWFPLDRRWKARFFPFFPLKMWLWFLVTAYLPPDKKKFPKYCKCICNGLQWNLKLKCSNNSYTRQTVKNTNISKEPLWHLGSDTLRDLHYNFLHLASFDSSIIYFYWHDKACDDWYGLNQLSQDPVNNIGFSHIRERDTSTKMHSLTQNWTIPGQWHFLTQFVWKYVYLTL